MFHRRNGGSVRSIVSTLKGRTESMVRRRRSKQTISLEDKPSHWKNVLPSVRLRSEQVSRLFRQAAKNVDEWKERLAWQRSGLT